MKILITIPGSERGSIPTAVLTPEQLRQVYITIEGTSPVLDSVPSKEYLLGVRVVTSNCGQDRFCPNVIAGRWSRCYGHDEDELYIRPLR